MELMFAAKVNDPSDAARNAGVQGIGGLVTSGRITEPQSEALVGDAIALILAGASTDGWRAFADEHRWHFWTHRETRCQTS
ncbi:hypothetical protein SKC41_07020 [Mycobacterium sp. 050128]|uniref:hypothetical protein n=1 Tax=Mycobacterium sp. 050128 TaxID=3096112 RepID=UPI002EDA44F5